MKPRFKSNKISQNSEREKEQDKNVNRSQQFRFWTSNQEGFISKKKYRNKFNRKGKNILDKSLRFIRNLNTQRQSVAKDSSREALNKPPHNVSGVQIIIKRIKKLIGDVSILEDVQGHNDDSIIFQDLDLLILGSPPEDYKNYCNLLRKEYTHMNDQSFKAMRLKKTSNNPLESSSSQFNNKKTQGNQRKMNKENSSKNFCKTSLNISKNKRRIKQRPRSRKLRRNKLIAERILQKKNSMPRKIDSDDDDCICIEPPIELINLDEEGRKFSLENNRRFSSPKQNKYLTSTPNVKRKPNSPHLLCETIILDDTLPTSRNEPLTALVASPSSQSKQPPKVLNKGNLNQYNRTTQPKRILSSQEEKMYFIHSFESNPNNLKVPIYVASTKTLTETSNNSLIEITTSSSETAKTTLSKEPLRHNEIIDISDDSVSAISTPEYIPLSSLNVKQRRRDNKPDKLNKKKEHETTESPKRAQNKKRMVIIDGNNVAYSHARSKEFSVKGLELCIQYFVGLGHEVKAVLPQMRLKRNKSSDPDLLNRLHSENLIVFTPCKNLPGKTTSSYDDRIILELADQLDGVIISNDNFKDLVNENKSFKRLIETRVIGFTWCDNTFVLPKDPYGRWGPPLSAILERAS